MPYEQIELPQYHGEDQEKTLDHKPHGIEAVHPAVHDREKLPGIKQEDILDQDPEQDHAQSNFPIK